MKKEPKNLLDFVPLRNPDYSWDYREEGLVTVTMPHNGFFDRVVQAVFHRPAASRIDLDLYGSYIWGLIDGKRTVGELAECLRERFGQQVEPLYERLASYLKTLKDHGFIRWAASACQNA